MRFTQIVMVGAAMCAATGALAQGANMPATAQTAQLPAIKLTIPSGEYVLDPAHASMFWRVNHLGLSNYTARLVKFDISINLDAEDVTRSTISATIDPRSVKTEFPFPEKEDFDAVIASKFLQADQYPTIEFRSTSLVATGSETGKMTGNLTFMGVTRPVTLDVQLIGAMIHPMTKKPALGLAANGSFKRSDFGSKELLGAVGDEVYIRINAEFTQK